MRLGVLHIKLALNDVPLYFETQETLPFGRTFGIHSLKGNFGCFYFT